MTSAPTKPATTEARTEPRGLPIRRRVCRAICRPTKDGIALETLTPHNGAFNLPYEEALASFLCDK